MANPFFDQPILNSPYEKPGRHWELDAEGQPTQQIILRRREAKFVTPIPKAKTSGTGGRKGSKKKGQDTSKLLDLVYDEQAAAVSTDELNYDLTQTISSLRHQVDEWRALTNPSDWRVTPETARLLQHWRSHPFTSVRPFFCQLEAVETLIWLTEVAPKAGKKGEDFLSSLNAANEQANPGLDRVALKLATGAGKTTVMALVIAWQTINAVRYKNSRFTKAFLIVTPGITIRDRLRVLQPNDPDSYYKSRELVPEELLPELQKARIVITNYHAFKLREKLELSKGTRSLLQGNGEDLKTLESEGQMLQRVMPELLNLKNVLVLNDEAHHCYQARPETNEEKELRGEEKAEAEENKKAASLWINGLRAVGNQLGLNKVLDLSATPFFLRGSGYQEGTLFPWTMSDFSLMDAIECGIVKLPRVPISDNISGEELPMFRNLWAHIRDKMPKKGRGKGDDGFLDPHSLPPPLLTALEALYGHYKATYEAWESEGMGVPPCLIVVCNNVTASKLVYDYISGFNRPHSDGSTSFEHGRLELFQNFDKNGTPHARPRTLLIDSRELDSGEPLSDAFHKAAASELERFRREYIERTNDVVGAANLKDEDILREVMNTVGKRGRLGASIRCVVSVSMLTEGWDTNTVTHVLGVRAFGTQLLCEQVVGRALRRQSYELNEEKLFNVEYADVLGIPFDFTATPVLPKPIKPRETVQVFAIRPDRDALELTFPRVKGYRIKLEDQTLTAQFTEDSKLVLSEELIGSTLTVTSGIIGKTAELNLEHTGDLRRSTLVYELTSYLLLNFWKDEDGNPRLTLFNKLRPHVMKWLDHYLVCEPGTYPAQLRYKYLANLAAERIQNAITRSEQQNNRPVLAVLDPYNPQGSTKHVNFYTSNPLKWETRADRCHVNWAILDSTWEKEFCRVVENHPRVLAYVKNQDLGFEVPYLMGAEKRTYLPDFLVHLDDGHRPEDPLNLIVEIKGYRGEDAKTKRETMDVYWVPGVNNLGTHGRWAFVELTNLYQMEADFEASLTPTVNQAFEAFAQPANAGAKHA